MTGDDKIPFLDLITPHLEMEEELVSVFRVALRTAGFVGGPVVEEFEKRFAEFCEAGRCVGVGSGTDALRFALIGAGVRPGDTVVTVPNTFIATTEAISQAGARPDFVDVHENTCNMDAQRLSEYFEQKCFRDNATGRFVRKETGSPVAAVVPVHLYGQMADMDPVLEVAEQHNAAVIEDACQAHGAAYYSQKRNCWMKAGTMGIAAAFSFYPGKNLGACGEAGAVTTCNVELAAKVRMLRDHGQTKKYSHDIEGYNGRLDAIQAGILLVKLKRLIEWNAERRKVAGQYEQLFQSLGREIVLPHESPRCRSVYHLYVVRVKDREHLQTRLNEAGIATQIHYPHPLHLQKAYTSLGYRTGDFPIAEKVAGEILSLPMYPHLKASQQKRIVQEIASALAGEVASNVTQRSGLSLSQGGIAV